MNIKVLITVVTLFLSCFLTSYVYVKAESPTVDLAKIRQIAEQGDVEAQNSLGTMYDNGEGVKQDYAEAVKWYKKAAEQGFAKAQFNLGAMYHRGRGVPEDFAEAIKWTQKAAEQGLSEAQFHLGAIYYWGDGVEKNYVEAYKWFDLAIVEDEDWGMIARDRVYKLMTPEQVDEAKRLIQEFKGKIGK